MKSPVNEIGRLGLGNEFEPIAPAQSCNAVDDIDHAFQAAMMVRPGLGSGIDGHGAAPEFRRPGAAGGDRGATLHSQGLCGARVQLVGALNPHPIESPAADRIAHSESALSGAPTAAKRAIIARS
jgi:hypothetical protein